MGAILKSCEDPHVKVSATHHEAYEQLDFHQHQNPYLSVLIKGSYIEYSTGHQWTLTPGSFIFRPSLYNHANEIKHRDCTCINIELKPALLDRFKEKYDLPSEQQVYHPGEFSSLNHIVHALVNTYTNYEYYLLQWAQERATSLRDNRLVRAAKALIHENASASYGLTFIAQQLYIHPVYLARLFKKATGMSLGAYQRQRKVENAVALLYEGQLSITAIAYEVGFFDTAHFIKAFKKCYGVTPANFRTSLKKLS